MKFIQDKILHKKEGVLMGDFNFDYEWENEVTHVDWDNFTDLWRELKPDEKGHTMKMDSYFPAVTFDHILLTNTEHFEAGYIQIVGDFCCRNFKEGEMDKVSIDGKIRTPSDHLGLYAEIKCL
jgi:endonuclease/exonuclease/phosphatase family metal-dependent hydrolase